MGCRWRVEGSRSLGLASWAWREGRRERGSGAQQFYGTQAGTNMCHSAQDTGGHDSNAFHLKDGAACTVLSSRGTDGSA